MSHGLWRGRRRRDMARDRPQECGDLACDGHDDNGVAFSLRHEASIPCAQARLRLPRNVAHLGWKICQSLLMSHPHASGMTIGPGRLDERLARAAVARL